MSETGNRSERGLIHIYCGDGKGKPRLPLDWQSGRREEENGW